MKEMYEAPKAEVTVFELKDDIAASGNGFGTLGLEDIFDFDGDN